jgi:hypothetical protein
LLAFREISADTVGQPFRAFVLACRAVLQNPWVGNILMLSASFQLSIDFTLSTF